MAMSVMKSNDPVFNEIFEYHCVPKFWLETACVHDDLFQWELQILLCFDKHFFIVQLGSLGRQPSVTEQNEGCCSRHEIPGDTLVAETSEQ